jgi:hypothetical protein
MTRSGFKTVVAQGIGPASGRPKGLRYSFETSSRHWSLAASVAVVTLFITGLDISAQQSGLETGPVLQTIRLIPGGPTAPTTMILEADGELPEPISDAIDGPPRVYLDLNGVTHSESIGPPGTDALVRRTRVALHSGNPLVTRVVFDLSRRVPYRIDAAGRAQGRLVVVLGGAGTAVLAPPKPIPAPAPAVRKEPPAPALPPAPVARPPRRPRESPAQAEAYAAQVSGLIERLRILRPILVAIDQYTDVPGDLTAATTEFEAIGQMLTAMKPPASREAATGLLVRACVLGARAARMRRDTPQRGDTVDQMNASSAAAGALILLDRATNDLGL